MIRLLQSFICCAATVVCFAQAVPPSPISPVEPFRRWLKMQPAEREQELATWPEANRAVIKRKLDSYGKMPEAERERRLQMLELRHFLRPLMSIPAAQREPLLTNVPPQIRDIVAVRLQRWDRLGTELQQRLLEHEKTLNFFSRVSQPPMPGPPSLSNPDTGTFATRRLEQWLNMPEDERRQLSAKLNEFFELPPVRQSKALQTLRLEEQAEIQKTLDSFAQLPPQQKRTCIDSFHKFANMSPHERNQFLKNAARWQAMSSEDRAMWRNLVRNLPPMPSSEPPMPAARPAPQVLAGSNATPVLP